MVDKEGYLWGGSSDFKVHCTYQRMLKLGAAIRVVVKFAWYQGCIYH